MFCRNRLFPKVLFSLGFLLFSLGFSTLWPGSFGRNIKNAYVSIIFDHVPSCSIKELVIPATLLMESSNSRAGCDDGRNVLPLKFYHVSSSRFSGKVTLRQSWKSAARPRLQQVASVSNRQRLACAVHSSTFQFDVGGTSAQNVEFILRNVRNSNGNLTCKTTEARAKIPEEHRKTKLTKNYVSPLFFR